MRKAGFWILRLELTAAIHLGALSDYWAARAARRIRKFAGEVSGGAK